MRRKRLRLAADLARTLDQLRVEQIEPERLRSFAPNCRTCRCTGRPRSIVLTVILDAWPALLKERGAIDLADRRNRLLGALARRWRERPPRGFVVAAGVTTSAPAVAGLLKTVSRLTDGLVILPGLDLLMPEREWDALGPHQPDPTTGRRRPSIETHPQFHLKLLLDRMGVGRGEVQPWRWGGGRDAPAVRSRAVGNAMAPAFYTSKWQDLPPAERRLTGVRAIEVADPAEEAQVVALALREALEVPGRTAALVTPDRNLARRVSAHLRRWDIEADDSAGRPLVQTPPGTLLIALANAAAERFAPVPLLALLKHPLVAKGEGRLDWLEGARAVDLALRGPRPPAGLEGISVHLADWTGRDREVRKRAGAWWRDVLPLLQPLERAFGRARPTLSGLMASLREAASVLSEDEVWAGAAGRAAADLFAAAEPAAPLGPGRLQVANVPAVLEQLMAPVAVRPAFGQHPRIFIWGLLEARLQGADLTILSGLNEGNWPPLPTPDPWLAPRLRHDLGLPSLERRIGLSAHDFAGALGGREVLVTRARRDARAPAVASRFWLRLEAMTGGMTRSPLHRGWAAAIDKPRLYRPAQRPAPKPPVEQRPTTIAVTDVDRLKADPFAFYARKMLGLSALDEVDADPSPAWRGSAVHAVLEAWFKQDGCDPDKLRPRAQQLLAETSAHPLLRALWEPRLLEAFDWIAAEISRNRDAGRLPLQAEIWGERTIDGVTLGGKVDRIDRLADNSLAIIDYKTGKAPSGKAVREGYSMQLGPLGPDRRGRRLPGVQGTPGCFEYWSLAKDRGRLGHLSSPVGGRTGLDPAGLHGAGRAPVHCRRGPLADRRCSVHGQASPGICALWRL
jgi:ATP-dependent helicase/nuclease subunit B